ncbi:MAG TPA: DUF378 domain-containing protein [Candidatus Pacearchaeota archaeon]|nr:DUF378 domain-containing protein [Clostridia bacterium]HOI60370.1 DUF378 domain-containing protein [Candidatus Pacearchaeota archaeon]
MKGLILPSLILVNIGALNWLLVGIFKFNLATWLAMGNSFIETAIYILIGIAGIILLLSYAKIARELI